MKGFGMLRQRWVDGRDGRGAGAMSKKAETGNAIQSQTTERCPHIEVATELWQGHCLR